MVVRGAYKGLFIITSFIVCLSMNAAVTTEVTTDFFAVEPGSVPHDAPDIMLYNEWKAAIDIINVVEINNPACIPLIAEFHRLYNQGLSPRFEQLEEESFEKAFPPSIQDQLFVLIDRFNGMIESVLDSLLDNLSITDQRALVCMHNLNDLFLAKKPKTFPGRIVSLLKKLRRVGRRHPLLTAVISASIVIVGAGSIYARLNRKKVNGNEILPDDGEDRSRPELACFDQCIENKKTVSQHSSDCGYGAAYVTSKLLQGERVEGDDAQKDYNTFLAQQQPSIRKYRTQELVDDLANNMKDEANLLAWLQDVGFVDGTNCTPQVVVEFFSKGKLPQWDDIAKEYEDRLKKVAKEYPLLASLETMGYHAKKVQGALTFWNEATKVKLSEKDYIAWLLIENNRRMLKFWKKIFGKREAIGGKILTYVKAHAQRIVTATVFSQDDIDYMNANCKTDDLSAREIEDIILPALGQQNDILVCGSPAELELDKNNHNKQAILLSENVDKKINAYRGGRKQGVLIRLEGYHWIGMVIDHKADGSHYAYVMDTLGSRYAKHLLPKQVMYLFTKADISTKYMDDSLDNLRESALRMAGLNKDAIRDNKEGALRELTRFVIFALYGKRGPDEDEQRTSYFEDNKPAFVRKCAEMKKVYEKIAQGIANPEGVIINIKVEDMPIGWRTVVAGPLNIVCNLKEHDTFEKFVEFIKQQKVIQGLMEQQKVPQGPMDQQDASKNPDPTENVEVIS